MNKLEKSLRSKLSKVQAYRIKKKMNIFFMHEKLLQTRVVASLYGMDFVIVLPH